MSPMRPTIAMSVGLTLLLSLAMAACGDGKPATPTISPPQRVERGDGVLRVLFAGDTYFGEFYQRRLAERGGEDVLAAHGYGYTIDTVTPLMLAADAVVANFETAIASADDTPPHAERDWVHWSDAAATSAALVNHGVTAVSLGNNHAMDYGPQGLRRSIATLEAAGVATFGAGEDEAAAARPLRIDRTVAGRPLRLLVLGGFEQRTDYDRDYGFYAGPAKPGVNRLTAYDAGQQVRAMRAADPDAYLVAFPHWGDNYAWRSAEQRFVARAMIDAGADLVIGHGAHMLQEIERHHGRWIVYSIGNFVFNAPGRYAAHDAPPYGLAAMLELRPDGDRLAASLRLYPLLTDNKLSGYRTRIVDAAHRDTVLRLLTDRDAEPGLLAERLRPEADDLGPYLRLDLSP